MKKNAYTFSTLEEMVSSAAFGQSTLADLVSEVQLQYLADDRPWVIGFSGGKDSSAVLQLVYLAIRMLPAVKRQKPLFVVSSDTLVETPVVIDAINKNIGQINVGAKKDNIPLTAHKVMPDTGDTFWVNLLGKGYPAPTIQFRWCTERMKIDPVSQFITNITNQYGDVIVILGTRRQESATRAGRMNKSKVDREESALQSLSRHPTIPTAFIYAPIEYWSHDDVWEFLLNAPRPWGGSNWPLFEMYKDSNAGECPLVMNKDTPSCGNSRFGCWVCTVVQKDKAIHGLIESGATWLQPMLEFRDALYETTDPKNKPKYRNFKRRSGKVSFLNGEIDNDNGGTKDYIPGPYWMWYRQKLLRRLLRMERTLRKEGHKVTLITEPELHKIRHEWLHDPNEPDWSDTLPHLYQEEMGKELNGIDNDAGAFTKPDAELLATLESKHHVPANMVMKLLEVELSMDGLSRRSGIFDKLESILAQDWGSLEEIRARRDDSIDTSFYTERNRALQKEYEEIQQ